MKIPRKSYLFYGIVVVALYLFFLVSFVTQTLASPTVHYCRQDQRDALLEFKHEFPVNESYSTPNNMSSWNKNNDCCHWYGVECDARSGNVISLDFYNVFLNNTLKSNSGLFKLQYLQYLSLFSCNLNGEIPSSLGNLSHLNFLDLSENELVGQVPPSIGNLTELSSLNVGSNKLTGNVPVSFCNLKKITTIHLDNNFFENSFFESFSTSLLTNPSLQVVNIENNQFNGSIEFVNTSSSSMLSGLFLAHNKFDGPIPESISKHLNLNFLDLSYNNFIGPIPNSISQLASLSYLDLSNNNFEGELPSFLWRLTVLKLSQNSFSNFVKPYEVVDRAQMVVLSLDSNMFHGPFPHWICKFPSLDILDISNNSFSGSIPQCLRNVTNLLHVLNLKSNNFSGILPDVFVNATNLHTLDISRNNFDGEFPKSLINCKAMEFLNMGSNNFKDKFPSWLGSLPSLNVLILRSNQFYGPLYLRHVSIGFHNLKVIDVSNNDFIGTFPAFYFSNWKGMAKFNAKNEDIYMVNLMNYNDSYRNSMEMVHKGVDTKFEGIRKDFRAIDFSRNKFYGKIPESIGLLKGLRLLNLSSNAFTSDIPKSLAKLTNLEALDLSQNQLGGQIPRDLGILSFLSQMNFSHNNLEGPIPQGTQFQSQNCSSFMENPRLYGLEEICGKPHVLNPSPQKSEAFSEAEEEVINWIAAAIAYGPGVFCGLVIGHIFFSHKHKWLMEKFHIIKHKVVIRKDC